MQYTKQYFYFHLRFKLQDGKQEEAAKSSEATLAAASVVVEANNMAPKGAYNQA